MAAKTSVEIHGKQTVSDAAKQAGDSLQNLGTTTSSTKSIFDSFTITAGDVANAVKAVVSEVAALVTEFAVNERELIKFNATMQQSSVISEEGARELLKYSDALALKTGEEGKNVQGMVAFLAASGRTETQIRALMDAAADMSVVTDKDLRTSVEELNKTFSGVEGRIGQIIPELKDLTEEELKNGAAIDIVAAKYAGLSDELSGSTDVALKNAKNAFDDLRAAVGGQLANAISPILRDITELIVTKLIPIATNLPEVFKLSFELVGKIIRNTLSWEGISTSIRAIGEGILSAFQIATTYAAFFFETLFNNVVEQVKDLGKYIVEALKAAFTGREIKSIGEYFYDAVSESLRELSAIGAASVSTLNAQFENLKGVGGKILSISEEDIIEFKEKLISLGIGVEMPVTITPSGGSSTSTTTGYDPVTAGAEKLAAAVEGIDFAYHKGEQEPGSGGDTTEGSANAFLAEWLAANDSATAGAEKLAAAVEGIDFIYHKGEQESTGGEASDESAAAFFDEWRAANDPLSAWIEGIIQANLSLQTVAASLGGFFGALTSVNLILNPVQTILGSMYDVLGPLIDTILAPIVGILRILGTTLGQILAPILSWFGPILSTMAMGFAWFYNSVILPIGNSLISVGNLIYNGIVTAINAMLGWIGVHFDTVHLTSGHLEKIDLATLSAAGMTSGAVSTAGGRSAQYSGGTINNINVVVNTAALVGTDGVSEFAIMIGREIQSSGVLGRV